MTVAMAMAAPAGAELSYRTHWLGHAGDEPPAHSTVSGFAVASDGTCLVSSATELGAPRLALYRDGWLVGRSAPLPDDRHRFTGTVAVSPTHIVAAVAIDAPAPGRPAPLPSGSDLGRRHGIWRFTRDGAHAPIDAGHTTASAFLPVVESPVTGNSPGPPVIGGLWIHEGEVFVSDTVTGRIRVYDEATLTAKRVIRAEAPTALGVLAGRLQVVERGAVVSQFSLEGVRTGQVLDEADGLIPGPVAPTPEGRLMVGDLGASQQVHFFNMSGVPTRVRTLGEEGGLFGGASPGEAGPRRFTGLTGVGTDAAGNLYVAMVPAPDGCVLRSFASDRKTLRWQHAAPSLVSGADADPRSDGLTVYSAEGRHALDLTKPPGQSWRWVAQTIDPLSHPDDLRLAAADEKKSEAARPVFPPPAGGTTTILELGGHKVLVVRSASGTRLGLYRFGGQTAVPALVIQTAETTRSSDRTLAGQPASGPWLWRDANADGRTETAEFTEAPGFAHGHFPTTPLDARGGLWLSMRSPAPHLAHWTCQGWDEQGIPYFAPAPSMNVLLGPQEGGTAHDVPVDFLFDAATDVLYQVDRADTPESSPALILTAVRQEPGSQPSPNFTAQPHWARSLPGASGAETTAGLAAAGALVFLRETRTGAIQVFEAATGNPLGLIHSPTKAVTSPDSPAACALRAHRRNDGSYLVFAQDAAAPRVLVHHLDDPLNPLEGK